MAWTYESPRKDVTCEVCGKPITKGTSEYRTIPGERPIRWRHTRCHMAPALEALHREDKT